MEEVGFEVNTLIAQLGNNQFDEVDASSLTSLLVPPQ